MFCKNCGNELEENALVCTKCGTELKKTITELDLFFSMLGDIISNATKGVISRKSFWFQNGIILAIIILGLIPFVFTEFLSYPQDVVVSYIYGYAYIILFMLLSMYSWILIAKRIHDFNATSWLSLLMLMPVLNIIIFIVFGCIPTKVSDNKYLIEGK